MKNKESVSEYISRAMAPQVYSSRIHKTKGGGETVIGLPSLEFGKQFCEGCVVEKQARDSFGKAKF
jgi:hypothetical protein